MSPAPRPRFPVRSQPPAAAIRFECACRLDASGSASLELSGELDRSSCGEFESRLAEAQRACAVVTLDLRRLTFMDGGGYAALVWAARDSRPDATLVLEGCGGQVGRLLDLVGLPDKVEIHPTLSVFRESAVSAMTRPGSEVAIGS